MTISKNCINEYAPTRWRSEVAVSPGAIGNVSTRTIGPVSTEGARWWQVVPNSVSPL